MANTPKQVQEKLPHVLIVEGKDEEHVIYHICRHYKISETFNVIDVEGIDNACKRFVPELAASNYKRVGLLVDNEPDRNIWESIVSDFASYRNFFEPFPPNPTLDGTLIKAKDEFPQYDDFGIWLMPNNRDKGTLEDFLKTIKGNDDLLLNFADETLTELEGRGLRKYKPAHRNKALIHTYLAWQENPGAPYGTALRQKAFDIEHPDVQALANWLQKLFV